jgi:chemotaxis protein CheZ
MNDVSRATPLSAAQSSVSTEGRIGIGEVPMLFREMMETIQVYSTRATETIYRELENLSRVIAEANAEIVAIQPKEICDLHLPGAADELDAIVAHTEQATNQIFGAVEAIEAVTPTLDPAAAEKITEAVTQIYEACSFQDLTGQRIAKVLRALREVQSRVGSLLVAFGNQESEVDPASRALPTDGRDGGMLHGPALPGAAPNQADIDALFG